MITHCVCARLNEKESNNIQQRILFSLISFMITKLLSVKTQYAVRAIGLNCQNLTKNGNRKKLIATCFRVILFDCIVECLKVISILICVASLFDLLLSSLSGKLPLCFFSLHHFWFHFHRRTEKLNTVSL